MQNMTPILVRKNERAGDEFHSSLPGGIMGFVAYWLALALPFLLYGSNTLFFFLYTWPFFLALLPLSVLAGVMLSILLRGHLFWTLITTFAVVVCLFWLLFSFLSGW